MKVCCKAFIFLSSINVRSAYYMCGGEFVEFLIFGLDYFLVNPALNYPRFQATSINENILVYFENPLYGGGDELANIHLVTGLATRLCGIDIVGARLR